MHGVHVHRQGTGGSWRSAGSGGGPTTGIKRDYAMEDIVIDRYLSWHKTESCILFSSCSHPVLTPVAPLPLLPRPTVPRRPSGPGRIPSPFIWVDLTLRQCPHGPGSLPLYHASPQLKSQPAYLREVVIISMGSWGRLALFAPCVQPTLKMRGADQ